MQSVKVKELHIILIGNFNPVIINPSWLLSKGIISEENANEAMNSPFYANLPELTQFNLPFCNIQITKDRYTVIGTQEVFFERVQELTQAIFTVLPETPILQIGINLIHHYDFSNQEEWHKFGNTLVPKTLWEPFTTKPGLKQLVIVSLRQDELMGEINTFVSPSDRFQYGVRLQVNDHYNLYTAEQLTKGKNLNTSEGLKILENVNGSIEASTKIINGVISYEQ